MQQAGRSLQLLTVLILAFLFSGTSASFQIVNTIDDFSVALQLTEFNNAETLSSFTEIGNGSQDKRSNDYQKLMVYFRVVALYGLLLPHFF